jgi:hypothetical protein
MIETLPTASASSQNTPIIGSTPAISSDFATTPDVWPQ